MSDDVKPEFANEDKVIAQLEPIFEALEKDGGSVADVLLYFSLLYTGKLRARKMLLDSRKKKIEEGITEAKKHIENLQSKEQPEPMEEPKP